MPDISHNDTSSMPDATVSENKILDGDELLALENGVDETNKSPEPCDSIETALASSTFNRILFFVLNYYKKNFECDIYHIRFTLNNIFDSKPITLKDKEALLNFLVDEKAQIIAHEYVGRLNFVDNNRTKSFIKDYIEFGSDDGRLIRNTGEKFIEYLHDLVANYPLVLDSNIDDIQELDYSLNNGRDKAEQDIFYSAKIGDNEFSLLRLGGGRVSSPSLAGFDSRDFRFNRDIETFSLPTSKGKRDFLYSRVGDKNLIFSIATNTTDIPGNIELNMQDDNEFVIDSIIPFRSGLDSSESIPGKTLIIVNYEKEIKIGDGTKSEIITYKALCEVEIGEQTEVKPIYNTKANESLYLTSVSNGEETLLIFEDEVKLYDGKEYHNIEVPKLVKLFDFDTTINSLANKRLIFARPIIVSGLLLMFNKNNKKFVRLKSDNGPSYPLDLDSYEVNTTSPHFFKYNGEDYVINSDYGEYKKISDGYYIKDGVLYKKRGLIGGMFMQDKQVEDNPRKIYFNYTV